MQTLLQDGETLSTYAPQSIVAISKLLSQLDILYKGDMDIKSAEAMSFFLGNHNYKKVVQELIDNTADYPAFCKRFFRWFDAFRCMKFLHFSRDQFHPNISILEAANWLNRIYFNSKEDLNELELLTKFRTESKSY